MSLKKISRWVAAGLVAAQGIFGVAPTTVAQSESRLASFQCQNADGFYGIRAIADDGLVSDPMVEWSTVADRDSGLSLNGQHCQDVANRLNAVLRENGGTLSGLYLTMGRVNGNMVVCAVKDTARGCNRHNVLFAFDGDNRAEPARELAKLLGLDVLVDIMVFGNLLQDFSPLPIQISTG